MVKTDTGKAGIGHRKTFKNDKEENDKTLGASLVAQW